MTKKEFETRSGLKISDERFEELVNDAAAMCSDEERIKMRVEALKAELFTVLFDGVQKTNSADLRKDCIRHMGKRKYLRMLLDNNGKLWDEDKVLLMDYLS